MVVEKGDRIVKIISKLVVESFLPFFHEPSSFAPLLLLIQDKKNFINFINFVKWINYGNIIV